jgi:hypothetical protein
VSVYLAYPTRPTFTFTGDARAKTRIDKATPKQIACIRALCRHTAWLPPLFMEAYFTGLDISDLSRGAASAVITHLKELDTWQRQGGES